MVLCLTILLLIITTNATADFRYAFQVSPNTYQITKNSQVDYVVITSKNNQDISRDGELMDAYKAAWENSEDRVHQLESKPEFDMWFFIGGFALGVMVAK